MKIRRTDPRLYFTRSHDAQAARRRYRQRMKREAKYCKVEGKYLVLGDKDGDTKNTG
jgi:hypothetical protein